jgi:cell division protein FtsL
MRLLVIAAFLACQIFAESLREKQLAIDKAGLAQDKAALTQTNVRLTLRGAELAAANKTLEKQVAQQAAQIPLLQKQIADLKIDLKRLQTDLDSRPATVILSGAAQKSIDNAGQQLKTTEERVKSGNEKTAKALSRNSIIEIGSLVVLGIGFAVLVSIFMRRRTRETQDTIDKLTAERDKAQASLAAIQEQLAVLLKEKGLVHGGE